jgi:hypothetical protein
MTFIGFVVPINFTLILYFAKLVFIIPLFLKCTFPQLSSVIMRIIIIIAEVLRKSEFVTMWSTGDVTSKMSHSSVLHRHCREERMF